MCEYGEKGLLKVRGQIQEGVAQSQSDCPALAPRQYVMTQQEGNGYRENWLASDMFSKPTAGSK